ncbi:MAG TPA: hypothetical protein PLM41_06755 [Saprospiraceae bacterium]|nr:hypothetical protein [Saprospiraceae bacterium]
MRRLFSFILLIFHFFFSDTLFAQHDHMQQGNKVPADTVMSHVMTHEQMEMPSAFSRNLPMQVNGSGTSWHPANSPMYMHMWHAGKWHYMLHYGLFLRYSDQNAGLKAGERGGEAFDAPNWVMLMANRPVGEKGLLTLRGMFSADALTVGGEGYPLLFQTGETWKGKALIDHQHPHDVFSELSVGYTQAFNKHTDVFLYFGMPGEPSVGPPAFMHRPSALSMPSAPLSHHWQDATHITFGVTTLGLRYKTVKLETSIFTGREPGEKRYDFDTPKFDSYSARVSVNPTRAVALQASYGWLNSPEALHPEEDIERLSASALFNISLNKTSVLSSTVAWGLNRYHSAENADVSKGNALLLEADFQSKKYNLFGRMEWVQKNGAELGLGENTGKNHDIGAFTAGAGCYLWKNKVFWTNLGVTGTAYATSDLLKPYYGSAPYSFEIFLRIIPPRM